MCVHEIWSACKAGGNTALEGLLEVDNNACSVTTASTDRVVGADDDVSVCLQGLPELHQYAYDSCLHANAEC